MTLGGASLASEKAARTLGRGLPVPAHDLDLALGLGSPDRRVTTGAFNLVRWGFAAPAPVIAGLIAPSSARAPFWLAAGVLLIGVVTFAWKGSAMAAELGERVAWSRRGTTARADAPGVDGAPVDAAAVQTDGVPAQALTGA